MIEKLIKSHADVMKRDNRKFNTFKIPVEIETTIEEVTIDKGVKKTKVTKVTKKLGQDYKDLNWYDFSIDSLNAVGALDGLQRVNLDGSVFDAADSIGFIIDNLDKNIEEK